MSSNFSVLISVYRKERPQYLREALDSVFAQTLRASEVVLVEDGPLTPELDAVVSDFTNKYPELKVVPLPVNGGLGKALNIGLEHCTYDLVARMDTDDIIPTNRFAKQVSYMENHPEISVCSGWLQEVIIEGGEIVRVVSVKKIPETHDEIERYGKHRCPVNHAVCVYRKSDVINSGGYGPFPEDYYLWARMMVAGKKFHSLQEIVYNVRVEAGLYARRGGWTYLKTDIACHRYMWSIGYLSLFDFLHNVFVRIIVRLMPLGLRTWVYEKFGRRA